MSKTEKENRKFGVIISSVFHVVLILLLFAFSMKTKGEVEKPVQLVMDFTAGSTSKGGSSAENTRSETVDELTPLNKVDPVKTQETKSPVTKSSKKKSDNSKNSDKQAEKSNPNSLFPGSGSGTGKGDGKGDNNDNGGLGGEGNRGSSMEGKTGTLGTGDGIPPEVVNPTTDQQGKVVIQITVDRQGKVIDVKVLGNHPKGTTTDPVLQNQAKADGFRFKFKPDSKRAEYSIGLRIINYKLR